MLTTVRIIVLSLLLCGTLTFGIIPVCIRPYIKACQCSKIHRKGCATKKQRIVTCCLIFFGGGVLLATCLVHLLHEVHRGFDEALAKCLEIDRKSGYLSFTPSIPRTERESTQIEGTTTRSTANLFSRKNTGRPIQSVLERKPVYDDVLCRFVVRTLFPFPEFITVCGFFLIYFVEELIKFVVHRYQYFKRSILESKRHERVNKSNMPQSNWEISRRDMKEVVSHKENENEISVYGNNTPFNNNQYSTTFSDMGTTGKKNSINDLHFFYGQTDMKELNIEGLDDFITVLALSFNSVFEGFAAGFQHTEISTWMLFVSLALHKFVSAFVVSLEMVQSGGSNLKVTLYVVMFSFMCPIGMLTATFTHRNLVESGSLHIGVLNAISVGMLLYVTFYEMLRQRKDFAEISGFAHFFVLLLGFLTMSVIEYFYVQVE